MSVKTTSAFADDRYDYYELQQDLGGIVPKGAIFVHDTDDHDVGSVGEGCLKLCWTPDGDCYRGETTSLCGGTVIFHATFRNSPMFKKVEGERNYSEIVQEIRTFMRRINKLLPYEDI